MTQCLILIEGVATEVTVTEEIVEKVRQEKEKLDAQRAKLDRIMPGWLDRLMQETNPGRPAWLTQALED